MRLVDDDRQPSGWLNYARPVKPDPFTPLGPNTLGEYFWPVVAEPRGDGSRVGLSLIPPPGMEEISEQLRQLTGAAR